MVLATEVTVAGRDSGWASMVPLELDSFPIPSDADDPEARDVFLQFNRH